MSTPEAKTFTFAELSVGQRAEFVAMVDQAFTEGFARLSGDMSPLHVDPAFAAETPFRRPIAHGMIAGALFSRLVGMELPGKYALYLSQDLKFHKPIFPGTEVVVSGEITAKTDAFRTIELRTEARDSASGTLRVEGTALVRVSQ